MCWWFWGSCWWRLLQCYAEDSKPEYIPHDKLPAIVHLKTASDAEDIFPIVDLQDLPPAFKDILAFIDGNVTTVYQSTMARGVVEKSFLCQNKPCSNSVIQQKLHFNNAWDANLQYSLCRYDQRLSALQHLRRAYSALWTQSMLL